MKEQDKIRFLEKVIIPAPIATSCWIWIGSERGRGYGSFWMGSKSHSAHKVLYEDINGPVPEGLELDHICRNRDCVNPLHLEPVTKSINNMRGLNPVLSSERAKQRHATRTHCKYGHEFTPENTAYAKSKTFLVRSCRTCSRARQQAWKKKVGWHTKHYKPLGTQ